MVLTLVARKASFAIAIAAVWVALWMLTMPIYPRFWQMKTLPVYGFVVFVALIFASFPFYLVGERAARHIVFGALYWTPIVLGGLFSVVWGLGAVP